jgi:hypothetical protein
VNCANVWPKRNVGVTPFLPWHRTVSPLGIRFKDESAGVDQNTIHNTFARFQFPESMEITFAASLKAEH